MEAKVKSMEQKYMGEMQAFKDAQREEAKLQETTQKFGLQKNENEMVLQELKLLEEDANVYKLVGPVLVKQDLVEAKANVNKRLEFIRGEIERVEQQLAKLQDKQSKRQQQMQQIGQQLQSMTDTATAAERQAVKA